MKSGYVFLVILVFLSCNNHEKKVEESLIPESSNDTSFTETDTSLTRNVSHADGPYFEKNEKGIVLEKGTYKNGKQSGKRYLFFEDGKIKTEENYSEGNFEGPFKEYFKNGNLYQEGIYKNNSMTGVWKTYYETGELKEEVSFVDNNENGPFKEYHKNGKTKYEGTYKDGDHEEGEMKVYNEDGEIIKKLDCKKGICNTVWIKKGYEDVKR